MIEMANFLLAGSNIILLFSAGGALSSRHDWKQIATRKGNIIENYEREVRELKAKNDRLAGAVDALWREDE